MRELYWLALGREEAEWGRLANMLAFIANRLRFSDKTPILHPRDINPFMKAIRKSQHAFSAKASMAAFHAGHPKMPLQVMKCIDGQWVEVSSNGE